MKWAFLTFLSMISCGFLQAVDWQEHGEARSRPISPASHQKKVGFTRLEPRSIGIGFTNLLHEATSITNQIYLNGSGVAAGDIEGDGRVDLYFCGLDGPNKLFRNLGDWEFEEITRKARVTCSDYASTGAAFADIDGDNDLDLSVSTIHHGPRLYLNNGSGRFKEHTAESGLSAGPGSMSMAFADVNGDGYLDYYVTNYRASTLRDMPQTRFHVQMVDNKPKITKVNGRPVTAEDLVGRFTLNQDGEIVEHGRKDAFFINDGDGSFTRVPFTGGFFVDTDGKRLSHPPYDWGLSVMFQDINDDLRPDIYVCNDFSSPDRVWINTGHGFKAMPKLAVRQTSRFSMGVDFSDINRDGRKDFFVVDMLSRRNPRRQSQFVQVEPELTEIGEIRNRPQYIRNSLFLKRADMTYAEITALSGVTATEWSWIALFTDIDLDGYEDLLVTNGHARDAQNADVAYKIEQIKRQKTLSPKEEQRLVERFPRLEATNLAYRNQGDLSFKEKSRKWGFAKKGISHGMALADLDRDGDNDVVVNNLNESPGIYRNECSAPRIAVRLDGTSPNTQGIGAQIQVSRGPVPQHQEVIAGGRYLSSDGPTEVFAAGSITNRLRIKVRWRSGHRSVVSNAVPNRVYVISKDQATDQSTPSEAGGSSQSQMTKASQRSGTAYFKDVSPKLGHAHHEDRLNDFKKQPLLPKRLSRSGPGLSWFDWNKDGWMDLIIGAGKGSRPGIFLNDQDGGFEHYEANPDIPLAAGDHTTLLALAQQGEPPTLLSGSMTHGSQPVTGQPVKRYSGQQAAEQSLFAGYRGNSGPLAMTDLTGDGNLALFVGGQSRAGEYPRPDPSLLFIEDNNDWQLDVENTRRFANLGPVNGAVFSDLNRDGLPDLILACDWGPIRIFHNRQGELHEMTAELGLDRFRGWWNGVASGDFNSDGRPDLVVSNWGQNTKYEPFRDHPLRLYYGEIGAGAGLELIEAHHAPFLGKWVPERRLDVMTNAIPSLGDRYGSFVEYGRDSVTEIFGEQLDHMKHREVNVLESMVFLNRGDRFESKPLPTIAQMAPAFGVVAGDYNGDGHEDIFLAQNFFSWSKATPRTDAGRGLWLRGNGNGEFKPISAEAAGIKIHGEQRGAASADYNQDGRLDLAVGQNGRPTKLFQNQKAAKGLRVRFHGPPMNPEGVGAQARIIYENARKGPLKEVQAGSGYWSQNSSTLVFGLNGKPESLRVRWPGAKLKEHSISPNQRAVSISYQPSN